MKLLSRRRAAALASFARCDALPRPKTIRPAEPYLFAGASEARRRGHPFIGTEHLLLALVGKADGRARLVLEQLGVGAQDVEEALEPCLAGGAPTIDPDALAAIGVDLDAVRAQLEATFGPGALERSRASCLGVTPRTKLALAYAVDRAAGESLGDEHILLGLLSVPDSLAARALGELGISLEVVAAAVRRAA